MLHFKRHLGIESIKSMKCDMYVSLSTVSLCYAFDIDKIGRVLFAINRCISMRKIISFSQSILKIIAKNYVGLFIFGPQCSYNAE